jgi:transposase-like protein
MKMGTKSLDMIRAMKFADILLLDEGAASGLLRELRWPETRGQPVCPRCGCYAVYEYRTRRIFRCRECAAQFSITSGTAFAGNKLPLRVLLAAIVASATERRSILAWAKEVGVEYKVAFVVAGKMREILASRDPSAFKGYWRRG